MLREASMSETVRIVEMGARDGLQSEKTTVSVADRIAFIEALVGVGLHTVEVGAFVSARASRSRQASNIRMTAVSPPREGRWRPMRGLS